MKVVINKCYGGFGISHEGMLEYARLKGITVYPEQYDYNFYTYWTVPKEERVKELENWNKSSLVERQEYNRLCNEQTLPNIERNDEYLVKVVETLGEKASDSYANLCVVEIPDDIEWEITEYNGYEKVEEFHRSWS